MALLIAALLRFWNLGEAPPGLYRDEAYNGLDALQLLQGQLSVFFEANNGREPAYIYLTALAISVLGRTALAVRLAAAVAGTVTTAFIYLLARSWFGPRTGLLAAWLWAVTLWPVHLSRIGLRPILLVPLLAFTFWLATVAYRRQRPLLWFAAGVAYGAAFYTYLAVRFTPLLLLFLFSYLLLTRPAARQQLLQGAACFLAGATLLLVPLLAYAWQNPELFLGRPGQVSILNPAINEGDLLGTLLWQTGRSLALFLWSGDTIVRHNPPGRPLFDLFMALPFLLGLLYCLRRWRRPPAFALLAWLLFMLGPTILAEDAPHFLRASGLLPAAVIVPALGLSKLWEYPKLPDALRKGLVVFLTLGTLIMTGLDYARYLRQPDTAYLFEAAATTLARQVNGEAATTETFMDRRFWEGWPSIRFLVDPARQPALYSPATGLAGESALPLAIYAWPYGPLDFVPRAIGSPAEVSVGLGPLARGDLQAEAYPLYLRYGANPPQPQQVLARFGEDVQLLQAGVRLLEGGRLQVDLLWQAARPPAQPLKVFVHMLDEEGIVAQSDAPPAAGYWPPDWWQPGIVIHDQHLIELENDNHNSFRQIVVGLVDAETGDRLPVFSAAGDPLGETWLLEEEPSAHEEN